MSWDYKDNRGKMHNSEHSRDVADRNYANEEKDHRQNLETAAKYGAIQSERAADAAEKQNALLAEQNKLLMMTPEERAAYKERLEEAKRQEQRRKAREAQEQAELQAYLNSPPVLKKSLQELESRFLVESVKGKRWGIPCIISFIAALAAGIVEGDAKAILGLLGGIGFFVSVIGVFSYMNTWWSLRAKISATKQELVAALAEQEMQDKAVAALTAGENVDFDTQRLAKKADDLKKYLSKRGTKN